MKRSLIVVLILFSLIGFVDAAFLTVQHYQGDSVVCEIGGRQLGNCNAVLGSEYATVAGVPVAGVGAVYYFLLFVLSATLLTVQDKRILQLFVGIATLGFLATLYFVYLQAFVLNATCIYCMTSAAATTILFVTGVVLLKRFSASLAYQAEVQ